MNIVQFLQEHGRGVAIDGQRVPFPDPILAVAGTDVKLFRWCGHPPVSRLLQASRLPLPTTLVRMRVVATRQKRKKSDASEKEAPVVAGTCGVPKDIPK
jgi:hypothetical protein